MIIFAVAWFGFICLMLAFLGWADQCDKPAPKPERVSDEEWERIWKAIQQ